MARVDALLVAIALVRRKRDTSAKPREIGENARGGPMRPAR
jgi:hypothetical protein